MGPSPHPQQSPHFMCLEMGTSQECCLLMVVMATCPPSGHTPHWTAYLTAAAKDSSSKGVSPSEWVTSVAPVLYAMLLPTPSSCAGCFMGTRAW